MMAPADVRWVTQPRWTCPSRKCRAWGGHFFQLARQPRGARRVNDFDTKTASKSCSPWARSVV